ANARLQYFTLEGVHLGFVDDVSFPADFDSQGELLLVSDLHARISLFDKNNKLITHLGYSQEWTDKALDNKVKMRGTPTTWENGRFVHPHDACFDKSGNIYVAEWVPSGRVSFLKKV
ncbi:MAG: peptidase, partial [Verrucomicrobiales bacterium]